MTRNPLLSVRDLKTHFFTEQGQVRAVDGVDLEVNSGEAVAIAGESGSGKSVTAKSIMGLIDDPGEIVNGTVEFGGQDLTELSEEELRSIRGNEISMVFQHPMTALNPTMVIGKQIARVLRLHREEFQHDSGLLQRDSIAAEVKEEVISLLEQVEISDPETRYDQYPNQMSGGMKQRVLIAMALACNPDLLIADEPTTALDVTVESKIFDLIEDLMEKYDFSLLLITHDLGVVAHTCDKVNIMYAGEIVETGTVYQIFDDPKHPYTEELLKSMPSMGERGERLHTIEGRVPEPSSFPSGCRFHPRCPKAKEECSDIDPETTTFENGQSASCLLHSSEPENMSQADKESESVKEENTASIMGGADE